MMKTAQQVRQSTDFSTTSNKGEGEKTMKKNEINTKELRKAYATAKREHTDRGLIGNQIERQFPKIQTALEEAQKRCTARTIDLADICEALDEIDKHFGLKKKDMEGLTVKVDCNAQDFPRAYKHTPESTVFSAYFKSGSWRIYNIYRDTTAKPGHGVQVIDLPVTTKNALIEKYMEF